MQKITPFLWFNNNVEGAVNFYTSIFKNSSVVSMHRAGPALPGEKGKVFTATFHLADQEFYALNGGPMYKFTPAISFFVNCETQEEIDNLWDKLREGGMVLMPLSKYPFSEKFGWVQDQFGISWQLNLTGHQQKISPFLLFVKEQHGNAEEAMRFYTSLFKNANILRIAHFEAGERGAEGTVKHGAFSLDGVEMMAMDSNMEHAFTFTPALSFFVNCTSQEEVDFFWDKLSEGGKKDRCGWLVDKYGVSWQIIPDTLGKLMYDKDPVKSKRVMDAMMKMNKLEIKGLQEAYDQQ
jgi:predicted 3-demethylubiquinone-9 3-methyltransferase (glyoxalase superfamily)